MVFRESLNPERKFSFVIPLVFVAILAGTTGVVEVALMLSPNASYAVNSQTQLAALNAGVSTGSANPTAAPSDSKEADKQCPAEKAGQSKYAGKGKGETFMENNRRIINLSWKKCQHTEDTDIAAQGYCIAKDICHADICDEKQCTLTKLPGGGTGTLTADDAKARGDLVTDIATTESKIAALNEEKKAFDAANSGGVFSWDKEGELKQAEQTLAQQKSAYEQITGYSYDDPAAAVPGGPDNPTDQQLFDQEGIARQENVARLRDEQLKISAELAKNPNDESLLYRQEAIAKELGPQNTFGNASLAKDAGADDIDKLIPQKQTWGEWFREKLFGSPTANPGTEGLSDGAVPPQAPATADGEWAKDFNYETAGAVDPKVVKAAADANGDWAKDFNYETAGRDTAREGIVPGTDQPGVDCTKGGCIDAKGNPIPAATPKPGDKVTVPLPKSRSESAPGPGADASKSGGLPSGLGSMLEGLMKGLGGQKPSSPSTPPQACATDQNAYAQQQQQYQQALQQYNYQLQMYNQQQQQASMYGTPAPVAPAQPQPCTPSTGNQCQSQPQQPPASACAAGAWRATYSGACVTGWQCISTTGPKAELSCAPEVADVGSTLSITYGCSSGVASSSSFKVTTQPGGSATTTVANPPAGTNTATYTLACTDNGKTTGAQCSVQVARANIILVANPKTVPANGTSLLSWLTTGMQSCIISSPDQADFTARNSSNTSVTGAATSSAITTATSTVMFQLDCKTPSGADKQATTSVSIAP